MAYLAVKSTNILWDAAVEDEKKPKHTFSKEKRSQLIALVLAFVGLLVSFLTIWQYISNVRIDHMNDRLFIEEKNKEVELIEQLKKKNLEIKALKDEVSKLKSDSSCVPVPGKINYIDHGTLGTLLISYNLSNPLSTAPAANNQNNKDEGILSEKGAQTLKSFVFSLIYLALVIGFFICIFGAIFTKDKDRRDNATDFGKTILAFLIGALTGRVG